MADGENGWPGVTGEGLGLGSAALVLLEARVSWAAAHVGPACVLMGKVSWHRCAAQALGPDPGFGMNPGGSAACLFMALRG